MEQLHAPWRVAYFKIAARQEPGCVFCTVVAANRDAETFVVTRGKTCFVMLNAYPYNPGHVMVAPYAHKQRLADFTPDEMMEMLALGRDMEAVLGRVMSPHGFNYGINSGRCAGQGVMGHLHLHVVPRWDGDTNFMTVLSETRVLPEALADLHAKLVAAR